MWLVDDDNDDVDDVDDVDVDDVDDVDEDIGGDMDGGGEEEEEVEDLKDEELLCHCLYLSCAAAVKW